MISQTNRYGDLLREFHEGVKSGGLPEPRLNEIVRVFNELSERENTYKSWIRPDGVEFGKVKGGESLFSVSPSRSVYFDITSLATIANNTYTDIPFTGVRGSILGNTPDYYGCVKKVSGYNDRFTKQDFVPKNYPIIFFGDFGFDTNATGSREIFIEFFDKSNVSLGGYTFAQRAANTDWTNMSFIFLDKFDDGDYCKFEVWQDSGSTLAIQSANFGFMLG